MQRPPHTHCTGIGQPLLTAALGPCVISLGLVGSGRCRHQAKVTQALLPLPPALGLLLSTFVLSLSDSNYLRESQFLLHVPVFVSVSTRL